MSHTIGEVTSREPIVGSSTTNIELEPQVTSSSTSLETSKNGEAFTSTDPLAQAVETLKAYFNGIVNDSLKPSIASMLKACDANPQVEALLATPMLFGSLVFIAIFVSLMSLLIVFKSLGLFFHLVFAAIGVVSSMFAWSATIFVVTILISLGATVVFVTMNVMFAFISHKVQQMYVQGGFLPPSMGTEVDWNQAKTGLLAIFDVCKQNMQMSSTIFVQVWKFVIQAVLRLSSSIKSTSAALQQRQLSGDQNVFVRDVPFVSPEQLQEVQEDNVPVVGSTNVDINPSSEGLRRRG
ncbi:hypothetical protein CPB83DRAFT_862306 [Crepidotus variabilis]|uniref:Uncharacterized protein n=1 Tax=Crepidotus variabilis TaxID=179855 RepID=A0A9P6JK21_9AGAR|nr:hypothetical protein CPB83DRAFT_862306 [Crepidotus variabilis]